MSAAPSSPAASSASSLRSAIGDLRRARRRSLTLRASTVAACASFAIATALAGLGFDDAVLDLAWQRIAEAEGRAPSLLVVAALALCASAVAIFVRKQSGGRNAALLTSASLALSGIAYLALFVPLHLVPRLAVMLDLGTSFGEMSATAMPTCAFFLETQLLVDGMLSWPPAIAAIALFVAAALVSRFRVTLFVASAFVALAGTAVCAYAAWVVSAVGFFCPPGIN